MKTTAPKQQSKTGRVDRLDSGSKLGDSPICILWISYTSEGIVQEFGHILCRKLFTSFLFIASNNQRYENWKNLRTLQITEWDSTQNVLHLIKKNVISYEMKKNLRNSLINFHLLVYLKSRSGDFPVSSLGQVWNNLPNSQSPSSQAENHEVIARQETHSDWLSPLYSCFTSPSSAVSRVCIFSLSPSPRPTYHHPIPDHLSQFSANRPL